MLVEVRMGASDGLSVAVQRPRGGQATPATLAVVGNAWLNKITALAALLALADEGFSRLALTHR
ncbi:MAG TPA: hypothetical protein DD670_08115, partial [Planctomycetaceae bacterium]|nr:hypothetical protein [Planctomycetaceae bacterium]